ncbi:MAG: ABC transporter permease [Methanobacteriaceae archaeon]|jgi:putative ABC transport system permease protein|nr:ABC transporter permease [Candidatus Methanorudis spinitermitis]
MSFLKLIFKNPFRKRSRAILSILGIGIGIITIVALGSIMNGLVTGAEDNIHVGGSDFMIIGKMNSSSMEVPTISSNWTSKINNISGVNKVTEVYYGVVFVDGEFIYIDGIDSDKISVNDLKIINGTNFREGKNEIIIGKLAVDKLNKTINDTITMKGKELKIVGIFESGNPATDGEIYSSLPLVQDIMNDEGNVSVLFVKVDKGVDVKNVTKSIEDKYGKNISVITTITDMEGSNDMMSMLNGVKWGISLLAIIVGGIGIINTMIMSVYERTKEIGVLKSIGWSKKRIVGMILGESIVITLTAGIIGSIAGAVLVKLMVTSGILEGMEPVLSISIFLEAIAISLIVGIIGGLYPAIKASNLAPTEAMRHE